MYPRITIKRLNFCVILGEALIRSAEPNTPATVLFRRRRPVRRPVAAPKDIALTEPNSDVESPSPKSKPSPDAPDFEQVAALLAADDVAGFARWMEQVTDADSALRRAYQGASFRFTNGATGDTGVARVRPVGASIGPGTRCGPFILEETLGQGGTGDVFLAYRDDAFQQKVAIKVLHTLNSKVKTLFQRECRILAKLNHPYIAHLIETGELPGGQPWIAIEHIEGVQLGVYLQQQSPSLRARVALATKVCEAVSHAHQHMIIHRDIKPENVMVTADGNPKLLDFGIAVAIKEGTGSQPQATELGNMMTVRYASPEQIAGETLLAASDVYSLGVVFYEMLTGSLPYRANPHHIPELMQAIRNGDVTQASRVATPAQGGTSPFAKRLRGDLDTILQKALATETIRRYASVEALAADLRCYQDGLPIAARPATRGYRVRKFIARNPLPVFLGCAFVLLLITFLGVLAGKQREIAAERDIARTEKRTAETVTDFMVSLFDQVDPNTSYGRDVTAYEVIHLGRGHIERGLADEPEIQARLFTITARVYYALGYFKEAEGLYQRAAELSVPGSGTYLENVLERLIIKAGLGLGFEVEDGLKALDAYFPEGDEKPAPMVRLEAWAKQWRGRYYEAHQLFEALKPRRASIAPDELTRLDMGLAHVLISMDKFPEAVTLLKDLLERLKARYGDTSLSLARVYGYLGDAYRAQENETEMMAALDASDAILAGLFDKVHPEYLRNVHRRTLYAIDLGRLEEAGILLEEADALGAKLYKKKHPLLGYSLHYRGLLETELALYPQAEKSLRGALAIFTQFAGRDSGRVQSVRSALGNLLTRLGDLENAELIYRELLAYNSKVYKDDHPDIAAPLNNLGLLLLNKGKDEEAEQCLLRAFELVSRSFGRRHSRTALAANNLGLFYKNRGKFKEAEQYYAMSLALRKELFGENHPRTAITAYNLAVMLHTRGDWERSKPYYDTAYAAMEQAYGFKHDYTAIVLIGYAGLKSLLGHFDEGRRDAEQAIELMAAIRGPQHPRIMSMWRTLGDIHFHAGQLTEALTAYRRAETIMVETKLENFREIAPVWYGFTKAYVEQGLFNEARLYEEKGLAATAENDTTSVRFGLNYYRGRRLAAGGQTEQALAVWRALLADAQGVLPDNNEMVNRTRLSLVPWLAVRGAWDEAKVHNHAAKEHFLSKLPPDHYLRDYGAAIDGWLRTRQGDESGAVLYETSRTALAKRVGEQHYLTRAVVGLAMLKTDPVDAGLIK